MRIECATNEHSMSNVDRPLGIIIMERRGGQYSVTNCRNVGAMLGCRCDVSAFKSSKIDFDVSTFEDRCVDFRRSTIDVPTFEDR